MVRFSIRLGEAPFPQHRVRTPDCPNIVGIDPSPPIHALEHCHISYNVPSMVPRLSLFRRLWNSATYGTTTRVLYASFATIKDPNDTTLFVTGKVVDARVFYVRRFLPL